MRGAAANLGAAFRRVWARPKLVLAIALLHFLLAWAATLPASSALELAMDHRPAGDAMLGGDDGLWMELLGDQQAAGMALRAGAHLAVLVWGLFSWLLAGGLIATLALPADAALEAGETRGAGPLLAASATHAGRMLKLGFAGLLARLGVLVVAGLLALAAKPLSTAGLAELALAALVVGLPFALLWSAVSAALDAARAQLILEPGLGIFRALGRGLRLLWRAPGPLFSIVLVSVLGFAALTGAYHALTWPLPDAPTWAFALVTLLRLAVALGRSFFALVTLVAAARLGQ